MKKTLLYAFVINLIFCAIGVLLPSSDEAYNVFSWKLIIAQTYAVPALLLVLIIGILAKR